MKTIYQTPCISIQPIYHSSVLCASGDDSVTSDLGIHGGNNSSDVQGAY